MSATVLNRAMTEDELLTAITGAAARYGWLAHHVRRSDKALQQGNPGFPDLVLARDGDVLFVECKRMGGKLRPGQGEWLLALDPNWPLPGARKAWIVWPDTLDLLLSRLR